MTQSKHTKGPWDLSRGTEVTTIIANKKITPFKHVGRIYGENRDANARLISAAPEMLELLKEIKRLPLNCSTHDAWNEINIIIDRDIIPLIKKATGK